MKHILKKIILRVISFLALKSPRNLFPIYFRIYSLIKNGKMLKISYQDNYYFLEEKKWEFFNREQSLIDYLNGFKSRKEILKNDYLISKILLFW